MTNETFFIAGDTNEFAFTDKNKHDIEFSVLADGVFVAIDEHNRGWDQGGHASVFIPNDKWDKFVKHINNVKVNK